MAGALNCCCTVRRAPDAGVAKGTLPVPAVSGHDLGAHWAGTTPSWWTLQRPLGLVSRKIYPPGWRMHSAICPQG